MTGIPKSPELPESERFGEFGKGEGGRRMKKSIYNDQASHFFYCFGSPVVMLFSMALL